MFAKVKSSVLLQLKHRYSDNPNVTVFSQQELKDRGMRENEGISPDDVISNSFAIVREITLVCVLQVGDDEEIEQKKTECE